VVRVARRGVERNIPTLQYCLEWSQHYGEMHATIEDPTQNAGMGMGLVSHAEAEARAQALVPVFRFVTMPVWVVDAHGGWTGPES
jgi:N-acetylglutamate synthase-like GNAT family acetyltransferase